MAITPSVYTMLASLKLDTPPYRPYSPERNTPETPLQAAREALAIWHIASTRKTPVWVPEDTVEPFFDKLVREHKAYAIATGKGADEETALALARAENQAIADKLRLRSETVQSSRGGWGR